MFYLDKSNSKLTPIAPGVTTNGLAIVPGTPGVGSIAATEVDTTIFGAAAARNPGGLTGCGKTKGGGKTDCAAATAQALATSGGQLATANAVGTLYLIRS